MPIRQVSFSLFSLYILCKIKNAFTTFPSSFIKAENGTRTHDPFITSEVLYQLSYSSSPTNINFNRLTTDCQEHFPYVLREKEDAQHLSVMHLLQYLLFTTMSATVMIFSFVLSAFTFMMMVMITYSIWIVIQTSAQICFHLCICIAACSWE